MGYRRWAGPCSGVVDDGEPASSDGEGEKKDVLMHEYATLYEFMVHTKCVTYILMGVTLAALLGFWRFLSGRDKRTGRPD